MPQFQSALAHYAILTAMLAPALLMAATASLLTSANARLARVVDRLRALMVSWEYDAPDAGRARRTRSTAIAAARTWCCAPASCSTAALGAFVGTSLALAVDAFIGFRLGVLPTALAVLGVLFLLAASIAMGREVEPVGLAASTWNGPGAAQRKRELSSVPAACRACVRK